MRSRKLHNAQGGTPEAGALGWETEPVVCVASLVLAAVGLVMSLSLVGHGFCDLQRIAFSFETGKDCVPVIVCLQCAIVSHPPVTSGTYS
jgi:hypothetical protein